MRTPSNFVGLDACYYEPPVPPVDSARILQISTPHAGLGASTTGPLTPASFSPTVPYTIVFKNPLIGARDVVFTAMEHAHISSAAYDAIIGHSVCS